MRHMRPLNKKARRIGEYVDSLDKDVVALQQNPTQRPHVPMGCALSFSPGWEVDSAGGTAGLCQPVERDILRLLCHLFLAGAGSRPPQQLPGLGQQVCHRYERLAQPGPGFPIDSTAAHGDSYMNSTLLKLASLSALSLGLCQASTLFMGAYPNSILVFDEAQGKVIEHIPLSTGLPTSMRLSADKKTLYVTTNDNSGIEVIDVADAQGHQPLRPEHAYQAFPVQRWHARPYRQTALYNHH